VISDATVAQLVPMLEDIAAGLDALAPFVFDIPPSSDESTNLAT